MKKALAIALSLLLPSTAIAQTILPAWHMVNKEACYDFESSRLLLKFDDELVMHRANEPKLRLANENLRLAITSLESSIALQKDALRLLEVNQQDLNKQLQEAIKARSKAESNWMPGLGWTIAGVVTLVAGGIIAGMLIK